MILHLNQAFLIRLVIISTLHQTVIFFVITFSIICSLLYLTLLNTNIISLQIVVLQLTCICQIIFDNDNILVNSLVYLPVIVFCFLLRRLHLNNVVLS